MNIQEAIKQAGEVGKLRYPAMPDDEHYRIIAGRLVHSTGAIIELRELSIGWFTREDWEVVQPDFRVGDVVKTKGAECGDVKCRLVFISEANHVIANDELRCSCQDTPCGLTLIHRPERHVFEGVTMAFAGTGDKHVVFDEGTDMLLTPLVRNGKRYRVVATEMKEG